MAASNDLRQRILEILATNTNEEASEKLKKELEEHDVLSSSSRGIEDNNSVTGGTAASIEVVTFLPNAEGELKDIPGFGQVLETRSLQDGKVERYPISSLGTYDSFFSS